MKQLIQSYKTGELDIFDVPLPVCMNNGVLIKTTCSLVSAGTEKMIVDLAKKSLIGKAHARPDLVKQVIEKVKQEGLINTLEKVWTKLDTPIPLGYSCSGEIIEIGKNIKGFSVGDRVACGGAGFANHSEINYIPKNLFVRIPDEVDDKDASFVTVGAIALQGVRQTNPTIGEKIVVIGLGLLGQLTVQLLKANGCKVLGVDIDQYKIEVTKKIGADEVCKSDELIEKVNSFTNGIGADAVIITATNPGNQLVYDAGIISRLKGRIIVVGLVGMDIPRDIYYKKELEIKLSMSYGPGRYDPVYEEHGVDYPLPYIRWTEQRNFEAFLELVKEKRVTPKLLTTHEFDFENALNAYKLLDGEVKEKYIGILLNYNSKIAKQKNVIQLNDNVCFSDKINVGLIGAGNFTKAIILPQLKKNKDFNLVGLSTATGISANSTGKKYNFKFISTDNKEIINNKEINTAIIATRHNNHAENVINSLKAQKHTYVEKPLCISENELEEISKLYKSLEYKPILHVGFNRRFSPLIQKMKLFSGNNAITINYRINAGIIPINSWIQDAQIGGGRIIGEVCHFIDTCSYLTDSLPINVYASAIQTGDKSIPDEDNLSIIINYSNGSLANITYYAFGNKKMPKEYIEVFAPNVAMQMDDFRKLFVYNKNKKRSYSVMNQDKGFKNEFIAFASSIKTGIPAISFDSIYNTTKVTFKISESLKTHTVIKI